MSPLLNVYLRGDLVLVIVLLAVASVAWVLFLALAPHDHDELPTLKSPPPDVTPFLRQRERRP